MTKFQITAIILRENSAQTKVFVGRDAWALDALVRAGKKGVTPISHPAPRWSAYIHNLRKEGLVIDTLYEKHGGRFPGIHGRYVMKSEITLAHANDN